MGQGDKYYRGKGQIWLDTLSYVDCYKSLMNRSNDFEEVPDPNGNGTIQAFLGFSISGTVSIRKTGNMAILSELKNNKGSYEFDMIIKEYNPSTEDFETIKYIDCTVDEFPLSDFENRKITEIELPIKARDYQVIA